MHTLTTGGVLTSRALCPVHLLREFPTVNFSSVYIPPSANVNIAAELVAYTASDMQGKYLEALMFITGDTTKPCFPSTRIWMFQKEGQGFPSVCQAQHSLFFKSAFIVRPYQSQSHLCG